ncbi:MAG: hypothetical protein HQL14_04825 [Candidatus Omnitrophica bacterium]|nr:hypothetical protein [Candidatus Omnitrophota bacterium]
MLRHRLMDIRLAVSNTAIFIAVYAFVLGVPFYFGYKYHQWEASTWAMLVLATMGPFIFGFLRRGAEEKILEGQHRYQSTLLQATKGLSRFKTTDGILRAVAKIIYVSMGLKALAVYLKEDGDFRLLETLGQNGPWVRQIPVGDEERILARLLLGEKTDDTAFSDADINVLNVIAVNTALAMENAMYMQKEASRIQQEGALARRESLDMLVGTMAHEIDNPLTFVMGEADYLREMLESGRYEIPPQDKALITHSCGQIISGAHRVSNIIRAVEQYSKEQSGDMEAVLINQMLVPLGALLLLHKKRYRQVELVEDIQDDLPPVWGQVVLIEEVILNLIKNALHAAFKQNSDGGGKVALRIFRQADDVVIEVTDNGYGIQPVLLKQLFGVPTTTKGSAEGTGLGLYHVRRVVVDMLKGRVHAESEGPGKGARFAVTLPSYKAQVSKKTGTTSRMF